jgi:hypothetical protein
MVFVRLVATLLTAALLCGASCMPVHSERPVGVWRQVEGEDGPSGLSGWPVVLNGVWCTPGPLMRAPHSPPTNETHFWCWLVRVTDSANGVLTLTRLSGKAKGEPEYTTLYLRAAPRSDEGIHVFMSEEDAVLKGSYLWALGRFTAQDQLLVWMTDNMTKPFVELVETGQLPGQIVEARKGRSGVWDENVTQTVILGDLNEEHLKLIIRRRGELFNFEPWVIERLPPTEGIDTGAKP